MENFDQLVARSEFIIRGRVVDERTRLPKDERDVFTDYTVKVLEVFKNTEGQLLPEERIVVSRLGGNLVLEGKPVRIDTPDRPPVPWMTPHVLFIARLDKASADAEFGLVGGSVGAFEIERGKMVCKGRDEKKHALETAKSASPTIG